MEDNPTIKEIKKENIICERKMNKIDNMNLNELIKFGKIAQNGICKIRIHNG